MGRSRFEVEFMKVVENSPQRLKLQHLPLNEWIWGGLIATLSGSWVVMGLLFQPASARLSCDRPTPTQTTCELTQQALLRPLGKQKLFDLQSAEVRTQRRSKRSYQQVWLISPYKQMPLLSEGGQPTSSTIATQINQYIQNPQQKTLVVRQSYAISTFIFALLGTGMFACAIWLLLSPLVTCTFYERLDKVIIERRRWTGQKQIIEHSLRSVMTAEVEEKQGKRGRLYRPVLVLASMERLPISSSFINEKTARDVVYQIQKFLPNRA